MNCIFREAGSEGDMMADHSSNNTPEVGKYLEKFYERWRQWAIV